jgi:hypothetical protein
MKTPASVHILSKNLYPPVVLEWNYPREMKEQCVTTTGGIRVRKNDMLYLSTPLGGKTVGMEEVGNKIFRVYFRQFFLGYADFNDLKMYDIMNFNNELKV